jgi:hypothetical protein
MSFGSRRRAVAATAARPPRVRAAGLIAVIAGLAAWSATGTTRPPVHVIGLDTYFASRASFEATRLDRLDPSTLLPVAGTALKLGDAASGLVFDPTRRTIAIGGVNFGEVMLVDPLRLRRLATIRVRRSTDDIEVDPVAWPRRRELVAVVGPSPTRYLMPQRVVIIDPVTRRLRSSRPLHGAVLGSSRVADGRTVLLATTAFGRVAAARLVVIGPTGRLRSVLLPGILAGTGRSGRVAESRFPSVAAAGSRAFVVGANRVATVDLDSLAVGYHSIVGVLRALPSLPPFEPGSSGLYRGVNRGVRSLGANRLLVTGVDAAPVGRRYLEREVTYEAAIVDTRTWEAVVRFRGASSVEPAFGLWLGTGSRSVEQRPVGFPLIAFRPDGSVLWRRRAPGWWRVAGNRLIAGNPDGSWLALLDPRTGALRRVLGRSPTWPLEPFSWRS